ncbi:MAG: bifunctional DNA-formamidopyrimidine glycosylase/DNA-(apurinic or apyrimidinic site) lyase [Deltaproteobacteria bacterium]|jgi:formamidopyrimidine-DNA glycosylase|nr:bifunctional DNA-formamidopyrimidine glycosylase/DNA-(apurinic or apyrimidinic site) lyase [Deltaproteobacteria bacterium]
MPELPEVETIARQLKKSIQQSKILKIEILDPKIKLRWQVLKAKNIVDIFRLGKQIFFKVELAKTQYLYLAFHLRMTGRLIWLSKGEKCKNNLKLVEKSKVLANPEKHLRLLISTNNGRLCFYDVRRFGIVKLVSNLSQVKTGLEPLSKDFNFEKFKALFVHSKQNIKQFLLRQDKIVGIGNIYASEILFSAKVNPTRRVDSLGDNELRRIHRSIKAILKKAVENCGTTFSDFQDSHGKIGGYQKYLKVYLKAGRLCPVCKQTNILRITQQQRSTFYCPHCQL